VGRHLEQLALFALPSLEQDVRDSDEESESDSAASALEIEDNSADDEALLLRAGTPDSGARPYPHTISSPLVDCDDNQAPTTPETSDLVDWRLHIEERPSNEQAREEAVENKSEHGTVAVHGSASSTDPVQPSSIFESRNREYEETEEMIEAAGQLKALSHVPFTSDGTPSTLDRSDNYERGDSDNERHAETDTRPNYRWSLPSDGDMESDTSDKIPPRSESPTVEQMKLQLEDFKRSQAKQEDEERQKEREMNIRRGAEEAFHRRMEELRRAQEEAKAEIDRARIEAEKAAREKLEKELEKEHEKRRSKAWLSMGQMKTEEEIKRQFDTSDPGTSASASIPDPEAASTERAQARSGESPSRLGGREGSGKAMAEAAYVEDVADEYESWRDYEQVSGDDNPATPPPQAPTPSSANDGHVNIFDFLAANTPMASSLSLPATTPQVTSKMETEELEQDGLGNIESPGQRAPQPDSEVHVLYQLSGDTPPKVPPSALPRLVTVHPQVMISHSDAFLGEEDGTYHGHFPPRSTPSRRRGPKLVVSDSDILADEEDGTYHDNPHPPPRPSAPPRVVHPQVVVSHSGEFVNAEDGLYDSYTPPKRRSPNRRDQRDQRDGR